jgi:hypothetical protein
MGLTAAGEGVNAGLARRGCPTIAAFRHIGLQGYACVTRNWLLSKKLLLDAEVF